MFIEQRYEMILQMLEKNSSITVADITKELGVSEATARRDITALANAGRLVKVFGGAIAAGEDYIFHEPTVEQKTNVNRDKKTAIARYAAKLIAPGDFVYIDAGTTTGCMLDYITQKDATYVTNAVTHARRLAADGFHVLLVGGELKGTTEAVVGSDAINTIQTYHFSKGFFGTNGITHKAGITTPDVNEAAVKRIAAKQSVERYVLADSCKFGVVSPVTFAGIESVNIITDSIPKEYSADKNIICCME